MDILKKLSKVLSSSPRPRTERALYLYVVCNKCGENLRARVDVWNDLTPEYEENREDAASYHCRKVLVGDKKCYQPIELQLKFDKNHNLIDQQIYGGKYIEESEFNNQDS
jgi:hypothetical protein